MLPPVILPPGDIKSPSSVTTLYERLIILLILLALVKSLAMIVFPKAFNTTFLYNLSYSHKSEATEIKPY